MSGEEEAFDLEEQKFLSHETSDPSSIKIVDPSNERRITFNGLSKDEIMKYGTNPVWVRARWIIFILFWVVWFAMLAIAILIVIFTPKCAYRPKQNWWQKEVVYQLDVGTFKDSDGNGRGDLAGLAQKLSYFDDLGVKVLCLRHNLIDPQDALKLNPLLGSKEEDLRALKKQLDDKDMHLMIDMPIEYLESKDKETIRYWLTNFADGIRVVGSSSKLTGQDQVNKLNEWIDLVNIIYDETFRPKSIVFYPFDKLQGVKEPSLVVSRSLLNITAADLHDQSKFVSRIDPTASGFILGDYTMSRLADSFGKRDYLPIYHHLALLLKGTPFLLYGDELEFKKEDAYMKWDKSRGCGFSSSNETLQLSCKGNVREAMAHGSHDSLVRFYKKLIKLRAEPSFSWGELTTTTTGDENVISYVREAKGFDGYLVIANTDKDKAHFVDYKLKHDLPEKALVEYYYSVGSGGQANDFKVGETLRVENILLKPGELLILKFNRN